MSDLLDEVQALMRMVEELDSSRSIIYHIMTDTPCRFYELLSDVIAGHTLYVGHYIGNEWISKRKQYTPRHVILDICMKRGRYGSCSDATTRRLLQGHSIASYDDIMESCLEVPHVVCMNYMPRDVINTSITDPDIMRHIRGSVCMEQVLLCLIKIVMSKFQSRYPLGRVGMKMSSSYMDVSIVTI